jgi:serine/threonine protein kinase
VDSERWQRARSLFDRLVDTPRLEWEARLDAWCPDDAEVRREAREMLEADLAAGAVGAGAELGTHFGDRAPAIVAGLAEEFEHAAEAQLQAHAPQVGQRVGPFALERELGRGGMGAVWLAKRADGAYDQQVAVKLIRTGWDVGDLSTRFRAERQILAGLEHPHIARLLDGGVTADGKPWLALEYVDGVDLRAYCDLRKAPIAERLGLFLTVCEAVSHAHARLIVHRDLKPSNLLVTRDGQIKLLDFGIAKLVTAAPDDPSAASATRIFTPEYASPEQVRGEVVTTAVDVYALGLLLYELLTGRRPYRAENSTPAAYERAILDVEPTRPSLAVTQASIADGADGSDGADGADGVRALALRRGMTPEGLRGELRGDLDAIVLKALRKEPEQRYASVAAFADDVENYLAARPVEARRGGWRYRSARFMKRHALAASLAMLAVLGLAGGLAASLWQAAEARRQRDVARDEATKSAEVVSFLRQLFHASDPNRTDRAGVTARELLDLGVRQVRTEFAARPEVRAELLESMSDAYSGIGLPKESLPLATEVVALRREHGSPLQLASALVNLGAQQRTGQSDRKAAFASFDEAEEIVRRHPVTSADDDLETRRLRARLALARGVTLLADTEQAADAERELRLAASLFEALEGPGGDRTLDSLIGLARVLGMRERHDEALETIDRVIAERRRRVPVDKVGLAESVQARGRLLSRQKRYDEYVEASREALDLTVAAFGADAWPTAICRHNLATAFYFTGRFDEAVEFERLALEGGRKILTPNHSFLVAGWLRLGDAQVGRQEWNAAIAAYEEALRALRADERAAMGLGDPIARAQKKLDAAKARRLTEDQVKELEGIAARKKTA